MTVRAFRVVKAKHAPAAFDGEGARRFGGRWNSPGVRLVYTSGSLPLAVLEILVHLQTESVLPAYVSFAVEIPTDAVEVLPRRDLPADWRALPAPDALRAIGDQWAACGTAVALRVPSAILATEDNYILNPAHPDFPQLAITGPDPLDVDARVFQR